MQEHSMEGVEVEDCVNDLFFIEESEPEEETFIFINQRCSEVERAFKLRTSTRDSLWGNILWPSAIETGVLLSENKQHIVDKYVVELGAGVGYSSLVATVLGAKEMYCTDYPDDTLQGNVSWSVANNLTDEECERITVEGYLWGEKVAEDKAKRYDTVILSDLVFNHSCHEKLLNSVVQLMKHDGVCLVAFSPHRPHLLEKDMGFFEKCVELGFDVEFRRWVRCKPHGENDLGDPRIRGCVLCFKLTYNEDIVKKTDHIQIFAALNAFKAQYDASQLTE
ncbi:hypothetical protein PCE1_003971 [Barthelona sp. PCE]